jgi:hypothetical protein
MQSTEMALVESPAPMLVSVTPARIELGRPPVRELGVGGGILINPRGSFIGSTLEATFSVDESLLTGCKELLVNFGPQKLFANNSKFPDFHSVLLCANSCRCPLRRCPLFKGGLRFGPYLHSFPNMRRLW